MKPPIPRRLLPQTAWVRLPDEEGGYSEEEICLKNVRMDEVAASRATDYQLQNAIKGTLFVDVTNTEGAFELPAGAIVRMDGEESWAAVDSCTAMRADGKIHHWEIELR